MGWTNNAIQATSWALRAHIVTTILGCCLDVWQSRMSSSLVSPTGLWLLSPSPRAALGFAHPSTPPAFVNCHHIYSKVSPVRTWRLTVFGISCRYKSKENTVAYWGNRQFRVNCMKAPFNFTNTFSSSGKCSKKLFDILENWDVKGR